MKPLADGPVDGRRLVLFDLDGVLWDSRENMARSWKEVQARFGIQIPFEDYFRHIGRPFGDILARLGIADPYAEIETAFRVASMANIGLAQFYPGTAAVLGRLKGRGVRIGVITSKDELRTRAILAMLPLTVDVIRTPDSTMRGKPAPDHLLAAMAYAGCDPADTVYVGDMDADFEAARRARIDYAHAAWGYGSAPAGCDLVLREIGDVERLVAPGHRGAAVAV